MREFTQKFADLTIVMREAELQRDTAAAVRAKADEERMRLIQSAEEFASGVYPVDDGHVVLDERGVLSYYEKADNG